MKNKKSYAELEYTSLQGRKLNAPVQGKFKKGDRLVVSGDVAKILTDTKWFKEIKTTAKKADVEKTDEIKEEEVNEEIEDDNI